VLAQQSKEVQMAEQRFAALKRIPVLEEALPPENPTIQVIKGARIRFAPGQPTGLHRHPMSTVGVVTAGSFRFQPEGQDPRVLQTGDGFFEPAGRTILQFDNASETEEAEIVCYYLTDIAGRDSIEMLAGGVNAQLGQNV
jgi:quercetin dioxygenase-like cupin family protein